MVNKIRSSPSPRCRRTIALLHCLSLYAISYFSSTTCESNWRSSLTNLPMAQAFTTTATTHTLSRDSNTRLFSLKPAAIPLMNSGKALARSGELLIDLTTSLDLYGGSLSATGATIRNAGDCLAQAAASCRFKTAAELVIDELREAAVCLSEGSDKLSLAVKESEADGNPALMEKIGNMITPTKQAAVCLEQAGASILQREAVDVVANHLISCGDALELLAMKVELLDPSSSEGELSAQRMLYASHQLIIAGKELTGEKKEKPKGKSWIKG